VSGLSEGLLEDDIVGLYNAIPGGGEAMVWASSEVTDRGFDTDNTSEGTRRSEVLWTFISCTAD